jgi:hypothetical protein
VSTVFLILGFFMVGIRLDVAEEVTIGLPNIPAKSQVVAILLIIEIVGDFGRDAREHARLVYQMLGKAGEVSELTNVSVLGLVEYVSGGHSLVKVVHPEDEDFRGEVGGVFRQESGEGGGVVHVLGDEKDIVHTLGRKARTI